MHHFIAVVLLPKDTSEADIPTAVEKLLAPYDERLEVEPYDEECSCVGAKAMEEIRPTIYATSCCCGLAHLMFTALVSADFFADTKNIGLPMKGALT